ncbi:MAG: alpha-hydroxy-acid oxidizing protein [Gemmatimonadota bacterium]|nr:alpha-hydroxy-acid oxidizing protein [Gemmatimonadota bacterium]
MTDSSHEEIAAGPARQRSIYLNGLAGRRPTVPTHAVELARQAKRAMSAEAWAYIAGGAGAGATMRANREALDRRGIVPRMMRDVARRDLSIELFGATHASPLLLAPIGVLDIANRDGDLAVARAAAKEGVPMVISSQASVPMEAIARATGSTSPWFQLYWGTANDLMSSFVHRAEACGCSAIVLTLDTKLLGWRTRDLDLGSLPFLRGMGIAQYTSDPVFRSHLRDPLPITGSRPRLNVSSARALVELGRRARAAGLSLADMRRSVRRFAATYSRPSLDWSDLELLRRETALPIVLKGIQHPDDARLAIDSGVNAIVVSNHGGRQLDGAIGSLDALPEISRVVNGRIPILFDSGIRGGADIFQALALGATAVLLGRPYVYGLSIAGEDGVREVIRNVIAELDLTLGLAGYDSVRCLTADALSQQSPDETVADTEYNA